MTNYNSLSFWNCERIARTSCFFTLNETLLTLLVMHVAVQLGKVPLQLPNTLVPCVVVWKNLAVLIIFWLSNMHWLAVLMELSMTKNLDLIPVLHLNLWQVEIQEQSSKTVCVTQFDPCQPEHRNCYKWWCGKAALSTSTWTALCNFECSGIYHVYKRSHMIYHTYARLSSNKIPTTELADVKGWNLLKSWMWL